MYQEPESLTKIMEDLVENKLKEFKGIDIYQVTEVQEEAFTVNIKHPNFKKYVFNNVPIASLGLGNFKGIMKLPEEGDLVVVAFLSGTSKQPIILGTTFNTSKFYSQAQPKIKAGEFLLVAQTKGSYIFLDSDNNIIIRAIDSSGNKRALVRINSDNTVEIEADNIKLGSGGAGFARVGDTVEVSDPISGTLTGTITSGSSKVIGGN